MELNNCNGKHYSAILVAVISASALLGLSTTIIWAQQAQAYSTPIVSSKTTFLPYYGEHKVSFLPPIQDGSSTAIILPLAVLICSIYPIVIWVNSHIHRHYINSKVR